jgi:hypothetical protein
MAHAVVSAVAFLRACQGSHSITVGRSSAMFPNREVCMGTEDQDHDSAGGKAEAASPVEDLGAT